MNFTKFAKSVAPMGHIYTDGSNEWLTDGNVFMVCPLNCMMPAHEHDELPDEVKEIIHSPYHSEAFLWKAILPEPDDKIKNAIRVYRDEIGLTWNVTNDAWSLIEAKKDRIRLIHKPGKTEAEGLIVLNHADEIIGAILGKVVLE